MAAYDPAFAYELGVIVREGIRRMYVERESLCYYLTVGNEPYAMPPMPEGVDEGILKGLYRFRTTAGDDAVAGRKAAGLRGDHERGVDGHSRC